MPPLDPGQSRLARMLSNAGSAFAAVTLTTPADAARFTNS